MSNSDGHNSDDRIAAAPKFNALEVARTIGLTDDPASMVSMIARGSSERAADHISLLFLDWRDRKPNIEITATRILESLAGVTPSYVKAAIQLAAEPNENEYHNNLHTLEVFTLACVLGGRMLAAGTLRPENFWRLAAAALIHDYKHDGKGNMGQPLRLEKLAVDSAAPALIAAGATEHDMQIIRAMVYVTDVSKNFADPSATSVADTMKIYLTRIGHYPMRSSNHLHPEIQILHHLGLADAAQVLQDSDIGAGLLSRKLGDMNGRGLIQEGNRCRGEDKAVDDATIEASQKFFLERICYGRPFSSSGVEILGSAARTTMLSYGLHASPPRALPA